MMKKIIYKISLIAFLFSMASCSDYLEETNPNGASSDTYWSTLAETQATLNSVYANMLDENLLILEYESYRSDMAFPGARNNPLSSRVPWYNHMYNSATTQVNNKWAVCYRGIFRANQVIEGLTRLEGTVDEVAWTEQMAQARFFRGLYHFYVHSTFNQGEIPIHNEYAKSIEGLYKPLSPSAEVIAFFREDLKYAYENLPDSYEIKGKVSKAAAATILGTSHLYEEEYDEAKVYFEDVIHNSAYGLKLVDDMSLINTNAGEFNDESILEVSYTTDYNLEYSQWSEESMVQRISRYASPTASSYFTTSAWLTDAYLTEPLDVTDNRNWVEDGNGNTRLRTVSLRASAMVALAQDLDTEYYLKPYALEGNGVSKIFVQYKMGYFKHHTNHSIVEKEDNTGGTSWKSGKNIVINRLGEVYLMLAECLIQTGKTDEALTYINTLRNRWALQLLGEGDGSEKYDGVSYTQESLMNHLMYVEKPLECSVEGHAMRFIDLRRWGITKQRLTELAQQTWYIGDFQYIDPTTGAATTKKNCYPYKEEPASFGFQLNEYEVASQNFVESAHYYFPIPLSETLNNPNISN